MASLPVPGLQNGGFGWVTDLTVTDGYLLLPAIMAGAMHVMFRYGGESGQSNELMNPGMKSFMLWGMPGVIFLITGWQPAAICVWFAASGAWAMGQAMLMQKPAVRKFFGITPMYKAKPTDVRQQSLMEVAMGVNKKNGGVVDTTATSKSASKTGSSTMSYQAPNVRTTSARGAASAPKPAPTSAKPAPGSNGVMDVVKGLKGKWASVQAMAREKQAERREQKNKDDLVAAAQSYEKRAKQKRAMEKRGGR
jgi:YidC/Oxa1 family membrane protein insertase